MKSNQTPISFGCGMASQTLGNETNRKTTQTRLEYTAARLAHVPRLNKAQGIAHQTIGEEEDRERDTQQMTSSICTLYGKTVNKVPECENKTTGC